MSNLHETDQTLDYILRLFEKIGGCNVVKTSQWVVYPWHSIKKRTTCTDHSPLYWICFGLFAPENCSTCRPITATLPTPRQGKSRSRNILGGKLASDVSVVVWRLGDPYQKRMCLCFSTWSFQESLDTVFASNPKRNINQKGETFIFVHPVVESFKYMFWPWCSENTWSTDIFVSPKGVNGGSNDWDFLFVDTSCLDCVWI